MFGDVNHQTDNDVLFKELHKRIRGCLTYRKSAIYDACNISYKRRMEFLKSLNKIPCEKIAVLMATPYEVCLERNAQREREVPEHVIKRMYMNFNVPFGTKVGMILMLFILKMRWTIKDGIEIGSNQ